MFNSVAHLPSSFPVSPFPFPLRVPLGFCFGGPATQEQEPARAHLGSARRIHAGAPARTTRTTAAAVGTRAMEPAEAAVFLFITITTTFAVLFFDGKQSRRRRLFTLSGHASGYASDPVYFH